ncbi:hypothetical protein AAH161_21870, partial [Bacteroides ovatus]|uniref:hypothetical protein n=3 Tax=Bacteroides TaxID=816 RepID=UPI0039B66F4B
CFRTSFCRFYCLTINFSVKIYRSIVILMIAFSFSFSSCEKHDDIHYHSDCDIISIMVRANSPEDGTTYDGVISENGNITFELPAKVKLSELYVTANLPVAAFAYPSLTGAKDLSTPFKLTIVAGDGTQKEYTLTAKHPNN